MSFYRKYRPKKFGEMIGEDHVRDTLVSAVKQGKLSHAYLLTGPRGTGKTTTARLLAKAVNCLKLNENVKKGTEKHGEPCDECGACLDVSMGKAIDIIEIDAASNRGIDEIRELRDNVKFAPSNLLKKVYIIDEVHMLTKDAFNALLKTLEEPPEHAMFILATTEPHKIPATIISRTQRFDFRRVDNLDIVANLKKIAEGEKLEIEEEALNKIAIAAEGGHRDAISLFEQVASSYGRVFLKDVTTVLGAVDQDSVWGILRAIFNSNSEEGLKIAQEIYEAGKNMDQLNISMVEVMRKILEFSVSRESFSFESKEEKKVITDIADQLDKKFKGRETETILLLIEIFVKNGQLIREGNMPILPIEMSIVEGSNLFFEGNGSTKILAKIAKDDAGEVKEKVEMVDEIKNRQVKSVRKEEQKATDKAQNIDVSIPVAEMSEDVWTKIVMGTKEVNATLSALLLDAKPIAIADNKVVLGVKFKFHKDMISEAKNIKILEKVIEEMTGKQTRVVCELADLRKKTVKASSDDELLEETKKVFGDIT